MPPAKHPHRKAPPFTYEEVGVLIDSTAEWKQLRFGDGEHILFPRRSRQTRQAGGGGYRMYISSYELTNGEKRRVALNTLDRAAVDERMEMLVAADVVAGLLQADAKVAMIYLAIPRVPSSRAILSDVFAALRIETTELGKLRIIKGAAEKLEPFDEQDAIDLLHDVAVDSHSLRVDLVTHTIASGVEVSRQRRAENQAELNCLQQQPITENPQGHRLKLIDLPDLLALDIKPREMLLDPILPQKGLAMLYAARGTGKTHVGLGIARAVSTGTSSKAKNRNFPASRFSIFGASSTHVRRGLSEMFGRYLMAPTTENESRPNQKSVGAPVCRFLRLHEVKQATGLGHATIYEWMARGDFPKPVPLGGRRVGWIDAEITEWQNQRIAARDAKVAAA